MAKSQTSKKISLKTLAVKNLPNISVNKKSDSKNITQKRKLAEESKRQKKITQKVWLLKLRRIEICLKVRSIKPVIKKKWRTKTRNFCDKKSENKKLLRIQNVQQQKASQ